MRLLTNYKNFSLKSLTPPLDPETARWLSPEEKLWVVGRLPSNSARKDDKDFDWGEFKKGLFDLSNIAFAVMVMFYVSSGFHLGVFLFPDILSLEANRSSRLPLLATDHHRRIRDI